MSVLEYEADGHLFLVSFPLKSEQGDPESRKVEFTDQYGKKSKGFSSWSETIRFINWLHDNNAKYK